jgi:hypothetical protein
MTDEERQQAEAYIKLQDNVNELIDERIRQLFDELSEAGKIQIPKIVAKAIDDNPRSDISQAIANLVRYLNKENIK